MKISNIIIKAKRKDSKTSSINARQKEGENNYGEEKEEKEEEEEEENKTIISHVHTIMCVPRLHV